jgi:hypothetical protein
MNLSLLLWSNGNSLEGLLDGKGYLVPGFLWHCNHHILAYYWPEEALE